VYDAPYSEYVLGLGEMLFIPRWCWHFITAIPEQTALSWRSQFGITSHTKVFSDEKNSNEDSQENEADSEDYEPIDFSISISFWWGGSIPCTYDSGNNSNSRG
jgi:hypothetical protein